MLKSINYSSFLRRAYVFIILSAFVFCCLKWPKSPPSSPLSVVEIGSHIQCLFFEWTGYLCPGCGMTRSLLSFFAFQLSLSFYYHPAGPFLGVLLVVFAGLFVLKKINQAQEILRGLIQLFRRNKKICFILLIYLSIMRNF